MTESINPNGSKHNGSKGLAEGSWKGMKKYLEKDMLCEALRGRVSYDFTWYPAFGGLSAVFTVLLNGQPAKKFGAAYAWKKLTGQGFEIRYIDDVCHVPFTTREEYTDWEFSDALQAYRNQPIVQSIASENPIIRMFAIVDRRIGKRRLERLKDEVDQQPKWLRLLYVARLQAEGIITG